MLRAMAVAALLTTAIPLFADTPEQILDSYAEQAHAEDPAFTGSRPSEVQPSIASHTSSRELASGVARRVI